MSGSASVPPPPGHGDAPTRYGGYGQPGRFDEHGRAATGIGRDDVISQPGPGGGRPPGGGPPSKAKKKKRRRKIAAIAGGTVLVLLVGTAGFGYAMTSAPLPPGEVNKQTSMVFTSDGRGTIATFAVEDRQEVKLKQIPLHVQRAVIAAEDRSFYTNNGISPKGIARAISGVVTGDDKGGGSTITQQYIKNSRKLTQERSFVRKAKEIPMALKADDTYTKDEILEFYLNTIYLGRGRYGIQAASQGYFRKDVGKLTPEEGAVLAAVIKDPTNLDPANNPTGAKERWDYVLDGMAKEGWYDKAKLATAKYPTVLPKTDGKRNAWKAGANGILAERIREEVLDIEIEGAPITEDKLDTAGLRIYTTINPRMQSAAVTAARDAMKEQDKTMGTALAAVQPGTGRILAYYGGEAGYGYNDLAGAQLPHAPGSSMKPYVLAKALEEGISIKSVWNGSSPQKFKSRGDKVLRNSENDNTCKRCNLIDTTVKSLNTVYWALTEKVGARAVRDLAAKAGITRMLGNTPEGGKPKVTPIADARVDEGIGIGQFPIPVLDQANGFATFAANGEHATPYFVEKILDSSGDVLYQRPTKQTTRAFSEDVARDANYVMEKVVQASRTNKLDDGRKAAGKTGTQQYQDTDENAHAWMCGFTPQLAAAVWVGNKDADGPLKDKSNGGNKRVYGSGIPGRIWKAFMDAALKGQEEKDFKSPVFLGDKEVGNAPTPTPTPEQPSPTPRPTRDPDPQDSPTPDPTEEPGDPDPGDPGNPDPGNPFPTPSKTRTPRPPAFP